MPDAEWDALVRQQAGVAAEGREVAGELKKSAERAGDIESRLAALKVPSPPELTEPTKPPTTADIPNPLSSFGSVAAAFGMLASLMTRRPLITALNAATGAIVGAREGNQAEFKRNYEVWKQNSEYANEVNAWQTKRYQMIMDQYKNNIDKMQAELKVEAIRNNDVVMAHTIESGDIRNSENLLTDRTRLGLEAQRVGLQMAEQKPMLDAYMDLSAANKELAAAKKSGDPNKIADATKKVQDARNNVRETVLATSPAAIVAEERGRIAQEQKVQKSVASLDVARDEVTNLLTEIDDLNRRSSVGVTGIRGMASRTLEWLQGSDDSAISAPASKFASDLETLKVELPKLITGSSKSAVDERAKIERILGGLGPMTNMAIVKTQLRSVLDSINRRRQLVTGGRDEELGGTPGAVPSGASPYSKMSDDELLKALGQ